MAENIRGDRDTIFGDVLRSKEEQPEQITINNPDGVLEPDSKWSTGRDCPKCAHQLVYFEINKETGVQWYQCSKCKTRYTQNELDTDALYRMIPEDVVLRYKADMHRKGR